MLTSIQKILIIFIVILFLTSPIVQANDTVLDLMNKGENAYKEENYELAHDLLQQALSQIQNKISVSFSTFLPEAPHGWTAKKAQTESASSSSSSENVRYVETTKKYIRKSDQESIKILIGNSPNISKSYMEMAKVVNNPMMKKAIEKENDIKIEQRDDWYIFSEPINSDEYEITAVREGVIIRIKDADSGELARKFFNKIDLEGLNKSLED